MAVYLITYDLCRPRQEYQDLYEAIKSLGPWWHELDSVWVVRSAKSIIEIRDTLGLCIDSNDKLFVAELTGRAAWYGLSAESVSWLKNHLS